MQQYAINLRDYRIVLCTRETLNNIDYHLITKKVAYAIRDKKVKAKDIVEEIKRSLMANGNWSDIMEKKASQNIAHSQLTRENIEAAQTSISEVETGDVFDIKDDEGNVEKPEDVEKPKRGRKPKAESEAEELPLNDPE